MASPTLRSRGSWWSGFPRFLIRWERRDGGLPSPARLLRPDHHRPSHRLVTRCICPSSPSEEAGSDV